MKSTPPQKFEIEIEKIRRFATEELAKMENGPLPICYQIGADTLIVGKHKIHRIDDKCWRLDSGINHQPYDFFMRKSAIFYCIAIHKKKHIIAADIQAADALINKLEFDAILYRHLFKRAIATNDSWNEEFYSSKYNETMFRLAIPKQQLRQSFALINFGKFKDFANTDK